MSETLLPDKELKELLTKVKLGNNHYICSCPYCGKENHFYINRRTQKWDCKKCGEVGNLTKLLVFLGKLFLVGEFKSYDIKKIVAKLSLSDLTEEEIEDLKTPKKSLPVGFRRIYEDSYLAGRGFTERDFLKYRIGRTKLVSSLKESVIFAVDEGGICRGYVTRYTGEDKEQRRYDNSKHTNFGELLFGIDEVTEETETVIVVEGLMNKSTVDRVLVLDKSPTIKCVASFGKKLSKTQILKLKLKGVKNIILIFDYDAISEMKKYGVILKKEFVNTLIGFRLGDDDLNDSSPEEVLEVFNNLQKVEHFVKNTVKLL